jgi:peptidoglycan hydrolase-like protein with peptidoglycan-binding domain
LALLGDDASESDSAGGSGEQIRAVEATTGDLAELVTVDGVLRYGDPMVYTAPSDGTITRMVERDQELDRGDVAYAIDESPVVVFWGAIPLYRPLQLGVSDGADIEVLEENLAALGYTADGILIVDETFDSATTTAVMEFQEDLGLIVDGVLRPSSVLLLAGPAIVSDVNSPLGAVARTGNPVLTLQVTNEVTTVAMPTNDGLVTSLPSVGDQLATGDVAFEYDTQPVFVIIADTEIADTDLDRVLSLGVEDGDDIEFLELTLVSLGFDASGELEVDTHFDESTADALADWQNSLGLTTDDGEDGVEGEEESDATAAEVFDPVDYVTLPVDHVVIDVLVERGDELEVGEVVFTVGVSAQTLIATIDEADADLIGIGDQVSVEFAESIIEGTIIDIDDPVSSPANPDAETVNFEIVLASPPPASDSTSVDVEVQIVERLATGVTLIPASALISIGDGTYAVEEVRGTTTAFVAVVPGDFADGMVEVEGVEPGTAVVIPS